MPLGLRDFASEGRLASGTTFWSSGTLHRVRKPSRGLYVDFATAEGCAAGDLGEFSVGWSGGM